jgi:L-ascorbate metabolism protein UlaG (beta-lactamase superfamily)
MTLIPAIKKDAALVAETDALLHDEQLHIWWLGQSGFLIQWKGCRALVDPYLSDSLTKKYAATNKPHVRMSERVIDPALLKNIMVVSSSHNHTDHLDAETLIPILHNNPGIKFIIPEANRDFVAERLQCDPAFPVGLNEGSSATIGPFTFHGIPAKHNEIDRDTKGNCRYMGYVIQAGPHTLYHSGDTLWFEEMTELVKQFNPDIALLPINGNDPERKVAGNLNVQEAAKLAKHLGVKWVIPCHYDMFLFNTVNVSDFEYQAEKINQPYRVLKGGELFTY